MPKVTFKKNRALEQDYVIQDARPGLTILELAHEHGIPVGSNCGGVCGCSTCHVYVVEGFDSLEEMSDKEADRLDRAFDVKLTSRLGCQAEVAQAPLVLQITDESLDAFFDENPDLRRIYEETGKLPLVPRRDHPALGG